MQIKELKELKQQEYENYHILLNDYVQIEKVVLDKTKLIAYKHNPSIHENGFDSTFLALTYPIGRNSQEKRNRFFDSPSIIANPSLFKGSFAICLPSGINQEEWQELIEYIDENKNHIHFIFITSNKNELTKIHQLLSEYINIRVVDDRKQTEETIFLKFKQMHSKLNQDDVKRRLNYLLNHTKLNDKELYIRLYDDVTNKNIEKKENKKKIIKF